MHDTSLMWARISRGGIGSMGLIRRVRAGEAAMSGAFMPPLSARAVTVRLQRGISACQRGSAAVERERRDGLRGAQRGAL